MTCIKISLRREVVVSDLGGRSISVSFIQNRMNIQYSHGDDKNKPICKVCDLLVHNLRPIVEATPRVILDEYC